MLLFKKKFLDAIRDGRKTQTVRLWKACRFRTGQRSYVPGVGYIRVTAVDRVRLDELTDDDAVLDGFASAADLLAEIRTLYEAQLKAGYQAYRLRFRRMTDEETEEALQSRDARKAQRAAISKPIEP